MIKAFFLEIAVLNNVQLSGLPLSQDNSFFLELTFHNEREFVLLAPIADVSLHQTLQLKFSGVLNFVLTPE